VKERDEKRGFDQEVPAMAALKWNTEFMAEMNRSAKSWLRRWCE